MINILPVVDGYWFGEVEFNSDGADETMANLNMAKTKVDQYDLDKQHFLRGLTGV